MHARRRPPFRTMSSVASRALRVPAAPSLPSWAQTSTCSGWRRIMCKPCSGRSRRLLLATGTSSQQRLIRWLLMAHGRVGGDHTPHGPTRSPEHRSPIDQWIAPPLQGKSIVQPLSHRDDRCEQGPGVARSAWRDSTRVGAIRRHMVLLVAVTTFGGLVPSYDP